MMNSEYCGNVRGGGGIQTQNREAAEGSGGGVSEASAEIWKDFDGFKDAAKTFELAALSVVDAVDQGDKEAIISAAKSVGDSCKSCHRKFRN